MKDFVNHTRRPAYMQKTGKLCDRRLEQITPVGNRKIPTVSLLMVFREIKRTNRPAKAYALAGRFVSDGFYRPPRCRRVALFDEFQLREHLRTAVLKDPTPPVCVCPDRFYNAAGCSAVFRSCSIGHRRCSSAHTPALVFLQ